MEILIRVQILFEARLGLGIAAEDVVAVVIENASKTSKVVDAFPGLPALVNTGC